MLQFANPTASVSVNAALSVPGAIAITPSNDPTGAKDTAAIQAAENLLASQGGGALYFNGTYTVTGLVKQSNVSWFGPNRGSAVIQLAAGANAPLVTSAGFASLTGTGSNTGGITGFEIRGLVLDGNKANQTAAAAAGVQIYGYDFVIDDVSIRNFRAVDALYTEWGLSGQPGLEGGMEASYRMLRIHGNTLTGAGWHNRGPHDSHVFGAFIYQNGGASYGYWSETSATYSGGATLINQMHVWGAHTIAYVLDAQTICTGCVAEGGTTGMVLVRSGNSQWNGGTVFGAGSATGYGFQFGDATNTATGFTLSGPLLTGFPGLSAANAAISFVNTASGRYSALIYQPVGTAIFGTVAHNEFHSFSYGGGAGTPGAAPLGGLGTAPPAIVLVDGSDEKGYLSIGTGAGTTTGSAIQVTFSQPKADTPTIAVFPANEAAAALGPYVSGFTPTGFVIGFSTAPAVSKPGGTYYVGYGEIT